MTTLYLARPLGGTPFTHPKAKVLLQSAGLDFVPKAIDAEVIVSYNTRSLLPYRMLFPWKKFLVWTNEPRFDRNFSTPVALGGLAKTNIMNVYTQDIFWNNLHFLGSYHFDSDNNLGLDIYKPLKKLRREDIEDFHKKSIAAVFSCRADQNTQLFKDGINIDLEQLRIQYALAGHRRGLVDVFGKGWPAGLAKENSGYSFEVKNGTQAVSWWDRKIAILKAYHFNICLENTAYGYYCTEKIWHAIVSKCLPIYYGKGTKIYETFPVDSFLDCAQYRTCEELFDVICTLSLDDYLERLNLCIHVYNDACRLQQGQIPQSIGNAVTRIVAQINGA